MVRFGFSVGDVAELVISVGKETHSATATRSVLAELSSITRRVEPALEHAMRELTRVTPLAGAFPVIGTRRTGVVELAGIPAAGLLAGVGVRTLGPVVGPATWTVAYLELEHSEIVTGKGG